VILSVSRFSKRPPTSGSDDLPPDGSQPPDAAPSVRSARRAQQRAQRAERQRAQREGTPESKSGPERRAAPKGVGMWATLRGIKNDVPLLRYWWVAAIGLVVAIAAGLVAVSAEREPYQYSATAQIFLTSSEGPYYRTGVTTEQLRELPNGDDQRVVDTNPPDTDTLVQAANLYPLLIESDAVAVEREQQFGRVPGTVEARAIFSVETASRYRETTVPVIEVSGTSGSAENAVKLANDTVAAFGGWITAQQDDAGVRESQRILIQPLASARVTSTSGGPSYAIPILLGAAVFLAFCGLAVMLDSLARRSAAAAAAERGGGGAQVVIHPGQVGADGGESVREGSA
jgi:hypothetical protein